jgi:Ca-activated chloride channel family protein
MTTADQARWFRGSPLEALAMGTGGGQRRRPGTSAIPWRSGWITVAALGLLCVATSASRAAEAPPSAADPVARAESHLASAAAPAPLTVAFRAPPADTPAFGPTEVTLDLEDSGVDLVRLFLQGREVGTLDQPPWRFTVDVGEENRERQLRVFVRSRDGRTAEATLVLPAIRVDEAIELALQPVYVTAERNGERVLDLARADFTVRDDGAAQQLVTFERGEVPLTAVLLLDSSLSMRGPPLAAALGGARSFVRAMAPLDEAMLLLFADRVLFRSELAHDPQAIERALATVRADGGTALNDALYLALHQLATRPGRRVVVLLSDGVDVDSVLPVAEVAATAARTNALVYWLRLRPRGRDGDRRSIWRDTFEHRAELAGLEQLVLGSGGRIHELQSIAGAEAAFAEVLRELREQYVLGYYPSTRRSGNPWHRIAVEVRRPGIVLRHRAGYFTD